MVGGVRDVVWVVMVRDMSEAEVGWVLSGGSGRGWVYGCRGRLRFRDGMGLAVDGVAVGRDMLGEGVSFRCAPKSSDHRGYMTVFLSRCGG